MKRIFAAMSVLLGMSAVSSSLFAKGPLVEIRIQGHGLANPIRLTEPQIKAFNVWSGPGTVINGVEQKEGFIVEWSKGVVAQLPVKLGRYEVRFYEGSRSVDRTSEPSLVYVVSYAYNPSTGHGFVYLPGRDDEQFNLNQAIWRGHGLEGHWFRATRTWDSYIKPLVAKARLEPLAQSRGGTAR